jgi:hypothetical protein
MRQQKEDIYVVMSGSRPLHATKTKRQAERFINDFNTHAKACAEIQGFDFEPVIFVGPIKLFHPRQMNGEQMRGVREVIGVKLCDNFLVSQGGIIHCILPLNHPGPHSFEAEIK